MTRLAAVALVGVTLAATPRPAEAGGFPSSIDFGVVCTPGDVFRACASVAAWNSFDPITNEYAVFLRIANMQGRPGFEDLGLAGLGMFVLNHVRSEGCRPLELPDGSTYGCEDDSFFDRAADFSYGIHDPVEYVESSGPSRYLAHDQEYYYRTDTDGVSIGYLYNDDDRALMYGCDSPPGEQSPAFRMCEGFGQFKFSYGPDIRVALTERTELYLLFDEPGVTCSTKAGEAFGLGRTSPNVCVRVPEPSSLLLLATGSLVLAYVGRRRATDRP